MDLVGSNIRTSESKLIWKVLPQVLIGSSEVLVGSGHRDQNQAGSTASEPTDPVFLPRPGAGDRNQNRYGSVRVGSGSEEPANGSSSTVHGDLDPAGTRTTAEFWIMILSSGPVLVLLRVLSLDQVQNQNRCYRPVRDKHQNFSIISGSGSVRDPNIPEPGCSEPDPSVQTGPVHQQWIRRRDVLEEVLTRQSVHLVVLDQRLLGPVGSGLQRFYVGRRVPEQNRVRRVPVQQRGSGSSKRSVRAERRNRYHR